MRCFAELAYNGAPFCGWQRQPSSPSVQQRFEDALATVVRAPVPVVGAGRTDSGVHARRMWAHFDLPDSICDLRRLALSLDRLCGPDIAVRQVRQVRPDAHARFDAVSRTYRYYVSHRKSPFTRGLSWQIPHPLNYGAMNEAASILLETSDFTSFAKLHSDARTNICRLTEARWTLTEEGAVFQISADRFLRNMVRAVVGTLVEVGRGRLNIDGFRDVVIARDRCAAGESVPAHGLYLWDVVYPPEIFLP